MATNEASIPVSNLTVSKIKKGITVRAWLRPESLTSPRARVLCVSSIFSFFVNHEGSVWLVYQAKRVGVNSESIGKWNEVFFSISRKFMDLRINSLQQQIHYKHMRSIVPSSVTTLTSAVLLGSADISKLRCKELVVLSKG